MKYKETIRRALRTFLQAFLAYIVTNAAVVCNSLQEGEDPEILGRVVIGFVAAAIAAGAAAVMNLPEKDEGEG